MDPRGRVLHLISTFMEGQGYKLISVDRYENCLKMLRDGEEVVVRVVEEGEGGDLLSAVIKSALDASEGRVAYVALPFKLLSKIGDRAFRLHRIGLLAYGDHGVLELVEGSPKKQMRRDERKDDTEALKVIIESLSMRISAIEEALDSLKDLRRKVEELDSKIDLLKEAGRVDVEQTSVRTEQEPKVQAARRVRHQVRTELPDFLEGNPWIEVLSSRGG